MIKISKLENGGENFRVNCWAVLSRDKKVIQCFIDESLPDYKIQIKAFQEQGFKVIALTGEDNFPPRRIEITAKQLIAALESTLDKKVIDHILKKLGLNEI